MHARNTPVGVYLTSAFEDELPHLIKSFLVIDPDASMHTQEWSPLILDDIGLEEMINKVTD